MEQIELKIEEEQKKENWLRIEFDGGTSCNIPKPEFGIGYGSYKIGLEKIVRLDFGVPMSANEAEIWTAIKAIEDATQNHPKQLLDLRGDSKITINWINRLQSRPTRIWQNQGWRDGFYKSILELQHVILKAKHCRAEWRSRNESVKIFGH